MSNILKNKTTQYLIAFAVVVIVVFVFFDGRHWMHRMDHINWPQVLVGLIIGIGIGLFAAKRKW